MPTSSPAHSGADLDRRFASRLEHRAPAGEAHTLLHRHGECRDVALDAGAGAHLDRAERADVAVDAAHDERLFHLDVSAHDAVLADLQALAVEDVALELTVDAESAAHHERAAERRVHADHGVRGADLFFMLWWLGAKLEHMHLRVC